jgi:signal transduction histidine kinase
MTTSILETAAAVLLVVALVAVAMAVRFRGAARRQTRRTEQLVQQHQATVTAEQNRVRHLAEQQQAVEDALAYLAGAGLSEVGAAALESEEAREVELVMPPPLVGTTAARRIEELVTRHTELMRSLREEVRAAADRTAEERVTRAHNDARDATRAAVLTFATALVSLGSELAEEISTGVRVHQDDEAYATLMGIDHTSQQMLRVAQGYMVLAGGTLGRRLPATSFTDIARAAMGRVQGYERVRTQELDQGVVPRAVEALVHTLAILLDNAVRYSPPTAYAEVSFRTGHNGVTVIIDDAGLQMSQEQLDRARAILTGKEPVDIHALGAYPQTGFRVASLLAARYGFRVDLDAPNLFGGTRALVFVPSALLTAVPDDVPTAHQPYPARSYGGQSPEPAGQAAQQAGQSAPGGTTASGLTRRRRRVPAQTAAPLPEPQEVRPGRPDIAAAWVDGSRRGRLTDSESASSKGDS